MKNENFAERLFCDLRNAEIKLEKSVYEPNGFKIGEVIIGKNDIVKTLSQVTIARDFETGLCIFSNSPRLDNEEFTKTFTDAYSLLLNAVKTNGQTLKFHNLVLPRSPLDDCRYEEFEQVISRYVKFYYGATDKIIERWDVLVSNAE